MAGAIVRHESGFSGRTPRAETFQEVIGNVVRPALVRADRCGRYDFRVNHVRFDHLEVTVLSYGDPVEVDLPEAGPAARESLVLQLMLAGSASTYVDGDGPIQQCRASGHLAASSLPMRVRCRRGCRHFLVRVDRSVLDGAANDFRQGVELPDPRHALPLTSPAGRALRRYMRYLVGELDACPEFLRHAAGAIEQLLLAHILAALCDSARRPAGTRGVTGRSCGVSACVERAEAFMEAHLDQDIGLRDIVVSSGTSLRTLYRAFEQSHGATPMEFLRELRLERAHAELMESDPREHRVTDVALRWGFRHLSDFASHYRARFGCLPSHTLRQH